ncbi:MAG TPA: putative Ig domain-containing protein, partial [Bryobacteraceae bacterium]|nr:putative Ig domain-containing protein [Bryobacteraceae bacterium]
MFCHTRINLFRTSLANLFAISVLGAFALSAQTLSMVSGNGQILAQQFQTNAPLVVRATGSDGKPAAGVNVTWAITSGGPGTLSSASNTTDSNGLAQVVFTATSINTLLSYVPSTVTASAGSSSVNFIVTTVQTQGSVNIVIGTPSNGATLTAPSGTTIPAAVVVHVYAEGGVQSGQGIPNVGLRVGNQQDPSSAPPAACNAQVGIALTDSSGTATCNLNITGPAGNTQLVAITGEFEHNPTFNLDITPGASCSYSLSANIQSFSSSGGPGSVNVVTSSGCAWTATSNANFVSITSGASGTGNGTVSYTVAANTSTARSGTLTIAGHTYTVNQSAASSGGGGLSITTQNLPTGNVGANYSATLTATGGQTPYSWSINGALPSGLSLTPSSGVISGTPSSSGVYGFTATVTDAANKQASQNLSITINGGTSSGSFAITNVSFANGTVGQSYSQPLTTANFCTTPFSHNVNFSVASGSLPGGLSITTNPDGSHSIAGTPQSSGAFPFTLTATDTCGNVANASFTIIIGGAPGTQTMSVNMPSLSFTAQNGSAAPPSDQIITISSNTGTLNYSIAVNTTSGGNWLVAKSSTTGTTPGSFTVGVANYSALKPGPYTGSIVISSQASNSPVIINVTLTVIVAPAVILQSPSSFSVSQVASAGQMYTPVTQEQIVLASGAGPLHFTASASTLDGNNWLTVLPAEGFTPAALTASIDTGGLPAGNYTGTVVVKPDSGPSIPVTFMVTVTQQLPALVSVVNGASFLNGPVAPGEIVTVFGTALGPPIPANLQLDEFGRVANNLAGTQVLFDGFPAPIIYSAAGQVSAIVPYEIAGNATTSVFAEYLGRRSSALAIPVAASAPGIFVLNSSGQGAILNQDGSVNSTTNPAAPGTIVSIFATGEGQTNPAGVDGFVAQGAVAMPLLPVTVQIAGQDAPVSYAGAAPGEPSGV